MKLAEWENRFEKKISEIATNEDPAHDLLHFKRVVAVTKTIAALEKAQLEIVVPAAWLHDFVIVPKNSPLRSQASKISAERAVEYLRSINYPAKYHDDIAHAIHSHSFSANVEVKTIEAKVVHDADRLDGLGAIGIARCFATAGLMKRAFYNPEDPFCERREPDDSIYTIDHFFKKLFKTAETLKTHSGRIEGQARVEFMKHYLTALQSEIGSL